MDSRTASCTARWQSWLRSAPEKPSSDSARTDRQTARKGTVLDTFLVDAQQKGCALLLTCQRHQRRLDLVVHRGRAEGGLDDAGPLRGVRERDVEQRAEPAGPEQRRLDLVRPVGRANHLWQRNRTERHGLR
eukprot:SAG22_NODE_722_length_7641_cov_13.307876_9_plen_132_part_00